MRKKYEHICWAGTEVMAASCRAVDVVVYWTSIEFDEFVCVEICQYRIDLHTVRRVEPVPQ